MAVTRTVGGLGQHQVKGLPWKRHVEMSEEGNSLFKYFFMFQVIVNEGICPCNLEGECFDTLFGFFLCPETGKGQTGHSQPALYVSDFFHYTRFLYKLLQHSRFI